MEETTRQQKDRINNIINSIPYATEDDRVKIYAWGELKNNKIVIFDQNIHKDKGFRLKWCEECQSFTCHLGLFCCICKSKKTGFGNPDIHAKTIKSQIENGTFNMLNENIKYRHEIKFCEACREETQHRIWPDGKARCCKCDFKENGMKLKFCEKCGKETTHNGDICTECNPEALSGNPPNFVTKDNIKYYKDKELVQLCSDLLSGKEDINNYPGFEIRLGRVTYDRKDVLTDESVLFDTNFQIKDDVKYYSFTIGKDYAVASFAVGKDYAVASFAVGKDYAVAKNEPITDIIAKLEIGEYNISDFPGWNIRYGRYCYGIEDVLTSEKIYLNQNFIVRDDIKYYKNELITDVIAKLDSNEYDINNFPGWNKRFGKWHYNTEDVITGDINLLNGFNFCEKDGKLWYLERATGEYIPWEEFKSRFGTTNVNFLDKIQVDYPTAKIIPTFREQNSDTWKGAKEAFEQSIIEQGISWGHIHQILHRCQ